MASSTPAADVADAVVDAIRTRRFWILTHDEYHEPVVARFHAAVDGTAPSSPLG